MPQLPAGIRGAIIDLDGTMVDTAGDFHIAINRMRTDLGLPALPQAQIMDFVGKGTENLLRSVLSIDHDAAQVATLYPAALAAYMDHYQSMNGDYATVYPGVTEGLAHMRAAGVKLACVTNKPVSLATPLLQKKQLHQYFDVIYGGDSFPQRKPDPMPLLRACDTLGLPPAQVVAIGDSSNDAIAARAAGCAVLVVPYGFNHGQPVHSIDSDGIVQTLLEAALLLN